MDYAALYNNSPSVPIHKEVLPVLGVDATVLLITIIEVDEIIASASGWFPISREGLEYNTNVSPKDQEKHEDRYIQLGLLDRKIHVKGDEETVLLKLNEDNVIRFYDDPAGYVEARKNSKGVGVEHHA